MNTPTLRLLRDEGTQTASHSRPAFERGHRTRLDACYTDWGPGRSHGGFGARRPIELIERIPNWAQYLERSYGP